jgi:nucleoporin SEH1
MGNWTVHHAPWSAHEQTINKVTWAHPKFGQILASCSDDTSVEIWEEQDSLSGLQPKWHKRTTLPEPTKPIKDVAFCPSHLGLKIAAACMDGICYVYTCNDIMK